MKLYTINGKYPNVDFAFTITPEDVEAAAVEHTHPLDSENIAQVIYILDNKAVVGHEHAEYAHSVGIEELSFSDTLKLESGSGIEIELSEDPDAQPGGDNCVMTINNITQNSSGGLAKEIINANADSKMKRFGVVASDAEGITTTKPSIMLLEEI